MFLFSKREKNTTKDNIIESPILGKMRYINTWWSFDKIKIHLFGKDYYVNYFAASNCNKDVPNELQEVSYQKMICEKENWQTAVESAVLNEISLNCSLNIGDVIKVTGVYIARDGKYGLSMEIDEKYIDVIDLDVLGICPDQCFGVAIFPNLFVIKSSDIFDELFC